MRLQIFATCFLLAITATVTSAGSHGDSSRSRKPDDADPVKRWSVKGFNGPKLPVKRLEGTQPYIDSAHRLKQKSKRLEALPPYMPIGGSTLIHKRQNGHVTVSPPTDTIPEVSPPGGGMF